MTTLRRGPFEVQAVGPIKERREEGGQNQGKIKGEEKSEVEEAEA